MVKTNNKILLVEDDQNFGDVLRSYLEMHDFEVTLATDGQEGYEAFKKDHFDLCIFDVMMPKKDGFTLAKEVRQKDAEIPIVFLTAKTLKQDIRTNNQQKEFTIGKYHFNYPLRLLQHTVTNKKDKLSPKEAHLLRMFCMYKNDVLARSEALTKIWGEDNYFTARSMDVFVTKLRKYLKDDPDLKIR